MTHALFAFSPLRLGEEYGTPCLQENLTSSKHFFHCHYRLIWVSDSLCSHYNLGQNQNQRKNKYSDSLIQVKFGWVSEPLCCHNRLMWVSELLHSHYIHGQYQNPRKNDSLTESLSQILLAVSDSECSFFLGFGWDCDSLIQISLLSLHSDSLTKQNFTWSDRVWTLFFSWVLVLAKIVVTL